MGFGAMEDREGRQRGEGTEVAEAFVDRWGAPVLRGFVQMRPAEDDVQDRARDQGLEPCPGGGAEQRRQLGRIQVAGQGPGTHRQQRESGQQGAEHRVQQPPDHQADRDAVNGDRKPERLFAQRGVVRIVALARQGGAVADAVECQPADRQRQRQHVGFAACARQPVFQRGRSEQSQGDEQQAPVAAGAEGVGDYFEQDQPGDADQHETVEKAEQRRLAPCQRIQQRPGHQSDESGGEEAGVHGRDSLAERTLSHERADARASPGSPTPMRSISHVFAGAAR